MARRLADKFREVQSRIDSYLLVFPFISHIDITRRLDRIYGVLIPSDRILPSSSASSRSNQLEVSEEVLHRGDEAERFTLAELMAATNDLNNELSCGGFGRMYKGRLPDSRKVAVKSFFSNTHCQQANEFLTELTMLASLNHEHIVRLLGWHVMEQEKKWMLSLWRREARVMTSSVLVYEYMDNRSLDCYLYLRSPSSLPVRSSWKTRIEILLGVSRAIEYLHSSQPAVVHRNIWPHNILLDSSWSPRLSGFDLAVKCYDGVAVTAAPESTNGVLIGGPMEYHDPEYVRTGIVTPTVDVYSFGVVMLEVLTGRRPYHRLVENNGDTPIVGSLVDVAVPLIEGGEIGKLLDWRTVAPELTARQLEVVDLVARTAARCVQLEGKDRPAMLDVVAGLQAALELVNCDE